MLLLNVDMEVKNKGYNHGFVVVDPVRVRHPRSRDLCDRVEKPDGNTSLFDWILFIRKNSERARK